MKYANKGHNTMSQGIGELWVTIQVSDSEKYIRDGINLYSSVTVDLIQAALGDRVDIETATGNYRMVVPMGTAHGDDIHILNMGLMNPYKTGKRRGDFIVKVNLVVPKNLDPDLVKLMQEYAEIESKSEKNFGVHLMREPKTE